MCSPAEQGLNDNFRKQLRLFNADLSIRLPFEGIKESACYYRIDLVRIIHVSFPAVNRSTLSSELALPQRPTV